MTAEERTLRRLDPLGTLASRPLTLIGAVSAPVIALISTLAGAPEAGVPIAAVLALVLISCAGIVLAVRTSTHRAPAGRGVAFTVLGLALAASLASAAAYWPVRGVGSDWPPIATALLVLSLATYRPAKEILFLGILCSLAFGGIAMSHGGGDPLFVTVNAVAAVTPILALTLGGAAFASTVVRNLERWQREEATATGKEVELMRRSNATDERLDRVGILNRDVAPLFAEILSSGSIDREHQARAAAVARTLRSVMVLEADRSWLDELIESLPADDEWSDSSVIDDERLAESMSIEMRSAVRAAIVALARPGVLEPGSLEVVLQSAGPRRVMTIRAEALESGTPLTHLLDPYIAVLATLFDDVTLDIVAAHATLRFSYDRP